MDWFKGQITGTPHDLNGNIYGFRSRFSRENQSIETGRYCRAWEIIRGHLQDLGDQDRLSPGDDLDEGHTARKIQAPGLSVGAARCSASMAIAWP